MNAPVILSVFKLNSLVPVSIIASTASLVTFSLIISLDTSLPDSSYFTLYVNSLVPLEPF